MLRALLESLAVGFGVIAIYLVSVWVSALLSVKTAPREDMLFCQKHGPLRTDSVIEFMGEKVCSICFHTRLTEAEKAGRT